MAELNIWKLKALDGSGLPKECKRTVTLWRKWGLPRAVIVRVCGGQESSAASPPPPACAAGTWVLPASWLPLDPVQFWNLDLQFSFWVLWVNWCGNKCLWVYQSSFVLLATWALIDTHCGKFVSFLRKGFLKPYTQVLWKLPSSRLYDSMNTSTRFLGLHKTFLLSKGSERPKIQWCPEKLASDVCVSFSLQSHPPLISHLYYWEKQQLADQFSIIQVPPWLPGKDTAVLTATLQSKLYHPKLQMRKLRPWVVWLALLHFSKGKNTDGNPGLPISALCFCLIASDNT